MSKASEWFDPSDRSLRDDPYPAFERLRKEAPVFFHDRLKLWFFSRHEDIATLLTDKRLGRSMDPVLRTPEREKRETEDPWNAFPDFKRYVQSSFIEKEGPEHARPRKLVHKVFTPRRVADLRERVQKITNALLDAAIEKIEFDYRGHALECGQEVAFLYGSANRDEAQFEQADTFDIIRAQNPHLAFGKGAHFCIGAPLARMELQVTFSTLLRRAPRLTLLTEHPQYRDSFVFRGLEELRVRIV